MGNKFTSTELHSAIKHKAILSQRQELRKINVIIAISAKTIVHFMKLSGKDLSAKKKVTELLLCFNVYLF